ncbi:MAG: hypothetical protein MUF60_02480 [Vicinamibacterales bacterium]|nr:hypothetical protein [Vicinamibacterales bacterium]
MRRFLAPLISCALLAAAPAPLAGRDAPPSPGSAASALTSVTPGGDLAPVRVRHYRMAGRVRPLLFWFGRDDVGMARLVWRADKAGARGYELLVGTDPARAPRGINRWGFIAERADEGGGALLALMTRADEASYDEAEAGAGASANDFRAIRGRVSDGVARWEVSRVRVPAPLTVHDLDAAVAQVRHDAGGAVPRQMALAAGTRPGFLVSVAELLDHAVTTRGGAPASAAGTLRYVFGQRLYELRLRQVRRLTTPFDHRQVPAVHAIFEIHTLATGKRTAFEITSGTEGDLAGVPILIQWQPRWWLKVELHLSA